ncbi:MAG: GreA/GreB family elongation factor [Chitinophagaceae bacterium]|nr:GreA/GreB family elongation factor [Chitinophagaceae bacterium]
MKPIISNSDYSTLKSLISNCPQHLKSKEISQLAAELDKADIVADKKLEKDIIRLNSLFEAEDTGTKKTMKFMLTLPGQANLKDQKISVFSPLGVALIGFKKGMTIQWALPGGLKKIKILDVVNH